MWIIRIYSNVTASSQPLHIKPFTEPPIWGHLRWILIFFPISAPDSVTLSHPSQGVASEQKGVPKCEKHTKSGVICYTAIGNSHIRALRTSVTVPKLSVLQGSVLQPQTGYDSSQDNASVNVGMDKAKQNKKNYLVMLNWWTELRTSESSSQVKVYLKDHLRCLLKVQLPRYTLNR